MDALVLTTFSSKPFFKLCRQAGVANLPRGATIFHTTGSVSTAAGYKKALALGNKQNAVMLMKDGDLFCVDALFTRRTWLVLISEPWRSVMYCMDKPIHHPFKHMRWWTHVMPYPSQWYMWNFFNHVAPSSSTFVRVCKRQMCTSTAFIETSKPSNKVSDLEHLATHEDTCVCAWEEL